MLGYLRPYWYWIVITLTLAETSAYLGTQEPIMTQQIIDSVIGQHEYSRLIPFLVTLVATVIGMALTSLVDHYIQAHIAQHVMANVRRSLLDSLQKKSFSFYDQNKVGQLVSRMTVDVEAIGRMLGTWLEHIASMVMTVVTAFFVMVGINFNMTLICMAPMPFIFYFTMRFARQIFPLMRQQQEILGTVGVNIQQNIYGMKVIRTFEGEEQAVVDFKEIEGKYLKNGILSGKLRAQNMPVSALALTTTVAFIYVYGASLILSPTPTLTVGMLYLFSRFVTRLAMPFRTLSMMITQYTNAMAGAERVFAIMDERPGVKDRVDSMPMPHVKGEVRFDNVRFEYQQGKPVLEDIAFTAKPGEIIAVLGATGSGKSSLIYLIPRFYDVTDGRILIDGIDVRDVTLRSLRQQVGVVLQDVFLFSGTIRENIAFGKPDATQEEVETAAKLAKAHDFITSFPEGYQTAVGERGITLSGGQKQRMAIARTLVTNPRILVLDDSLSFVDAKTEQDIQQALNSAMKGRTTFVIAQRLSTIKNAHRIVILENGKISEMGTHEELIMLNGIYKRIYETQFEALAESAEMMPEISTQNADSGGQ